MKLILENANVTLNANEILKGVNFEINEGEKIAIVGRNGSGKTTLVNLLIGKLEPDNLESRKVMGKVSVGHLEQVSFEDEEKTLQDEVDSIFAPILKIGEKLKYLEEQMSVNPTEKIINDYIATEHNYEIMGGYTLQKSYDKAFRAFGFSAEDTTKKLVEFSGGQRTRIFLIKLLFSKPDILVLDEPTNHLDTDAIMWLEEYLKNYKKTVVFVSHDREFINNVANIVYEIENKKAVKYVGNYDDYRRIKNENYEKQLKEFEAYKEEKDRLQAVADRFRYKATKAKMAQSKLKQIERMEEVFAPEAETNKNFHVNLKPKEDSGLEVLKLENLKYGYSEPFGEISAKIYRGDRVAIIGGNGLGKSTLLKTIMGKVAPLGGKIKFGDKLHIGYFDQQTIVIERSNDSVLESFLKVYPDLSTEEARRKLGAFMFSGDDVFKEVNNLSGGERVRLKLAEIFVDAPNVLILDEPTNHLDIRGRERLEEILSSYEGTLIFVSHDRYFVRKLARGVICQSENEVKYFKDLTYDEFLKKHSDNKISVEVDVCEKTKTRPTKEMSEHNRIREKNKTREKLEREIKKLEEVLAKKNEEYNAPENCSNVELLMQLGEEIRVAEERLEKIMEEWLLVTES